MKICDLTQFYSPRSGGVKRFVQEKIAYIESQCPDDEHVLIVPGASTSFQASGRSRVYTIASPLVSHSTQYRALLNLRAVAEVIERERPQLIESADPYQLGWKAAAVGRALSIPVIGFYHSDFPEAYLRPVAERLGKSAAHAVMTAAQRYVRTLYHRYEATLVPSPPVAESLRRIGLRNVHVVDLGVNTETFNTTGRETGATRAAHGIPAGAKLLLYVGRLAAEKNTSTLFRAFAVLAQREPGGFHLLVVGEGQQREQLRALQQTTGAVTWLPFAEPAELAQLYRAADLFVHPGVQETFGLVALESQARGTPVVGIRGSAMDRIILHDQESWSGEDSPEALAQAIVATSVRDLRAIGDSAASAVADRFGWPRVFERLFCIYRKVCTDYRARATA